MKKVLLSLLFFLIPIFAGAEVGKNCVNRGSDPDWRFCTYAGLADYFNTRSNISKEFKLITRTFGRDEITLPHSFWPRTCYVTSHQMVGEYLGYAIMENNAHYDVDFEFPQNSGQRSNNLSLDVGYWGSVEHLMANWATDRNNGQNMRCSGDYIVNNFFIREDEPETISCCNLRRIPIYGECSGSAANRYWTYYSAFNKSANDPVAGGGEDFYNMSDIIGCNDHDFFGWRIPDDDLSQSVSQSDVNDARRIIKAFIDNDRPIVINVNDAHNVMVVGYADLGTNDGLPGELVILETMTSFGMNRYILVRNIDDPLSWDRKEDPNLGNYSVSGIHKWNQNLNDACKTGGWAKELDNSISNVDYKLCQNIPSDLDCNQGADGRLPNGTNNRYYGFNLECWDNGFLKREYYATPENPFIVTPTNTTCDDLVIRYADGTNNAVNNVHVIRYAFNENTNQWRQFSEYKSNASVKANVDGRKGAHSIIEIPQWQSNYYMTATGLSGTYSKRRTTFKMTFNDGTIKYYEVSPEKTFGIGITLVNSTRQLAKPFLNANIDVAYDNANDQKQYFINELYDIDSDGVEVTVRPGRNGLVLLDADITRFGYRTINSTWEQISSTWSPDEIEHLYTNLGGDEARITWDNVWPDNNYWLVADGLSGTWSEQKTVIRLYYGTEADRSTRSFTETIEISAY